MLLGEKKKKQRASNTRISIRPLKGWELVIGVEPHSREREIIVNHNAGFTTSIRLAVCKFCHVIKGVDFGYS